MKKSQIHNIIELKNCGGVPNNPKNPISETDEDLSDEKSRSDNLTLILCYNQDVIVKNLYLYCCQVLAKCAFFYYLYIL